MATNQQFGSKDRLDDLRDKVDEKIGTKISDKTFWAVIVLLAASVGGTYYWLMGMNQKITRVETIVEMMPQPGRAVTPKK